MVRETSTVRGDFDSHVGPIQGVVQRLKMFSGTVMDLAGLQAQLVAEDSKQAQRSLKVAGLAGVLAVVLLITSLPLLGLGIVELLVAQGWDRATALLGFGCTLSVLAAVLLTAAWRFSSRATAAFSNSRREALNNLAWLRSAIDHQESDHRELGHGTVGDR